MNVTALLTNTIDKIKKLQRIVIQFPSVHTSSTGNLKAFFRRANSGYEELSKKKLTVGDDVIQRFFSLENGFEAEVVS